MSEVLVVCYSRSGKTRWVAGRLAEMLSADIEQITEKKDRSGLLGYLTAGKDTVLDRPAEVTSRHSLEGKKTVVIGMPVWALAPPPPVRAYLRSVDLAGKRVCAFATMDGSGGERTLDALSKLVPGGLAERLVLKKPAPDDPGLLAQLTDWAERIRTSSR
jgi:flavodoxin